MHAHPLSNDRRLKLRSLVAACVVTAAFSSVGVQVTRLGLAGGAEVSLSRTEPVATSFARPDIVDRNGRLLATDVEAPSLYADPSLVIDRDEVAEKLATVLPGFNEAELRQALEDKTRRFVWVRRGLSPKLAQAVHDLGLPGLSFRREQRRVYPAGDSAGHVLGAVDPDNKGVAGIERFIDDSGWIEPVHGISLNDRAPVRLSLDLGVQHAVEDELETAMRRYKAEAASAVVLDAVTGEVVASASLPGVDPGRPSMRLEPGRIDRITGGTYELGSIFKAMTLAMAFENGTAKSETVLDVREPLVAGRFTIVDPHPAGRPLSVAEIFTHSSNVGAGMLALRSGGEKMHGFFERMNLTAVMKTETGLVAAPQLPVRFERAETITAAYGHGIAVAPLQFASAGATLINGGKRVTPTYLRRHPEAEVPRDRVVSAATSDAINKLMRANVESAGGTGRRAAVNGVSIGGKTGTAEIAHAGGYNKKAVISSFFAAFPMDAPRYVTLVSIYEPQPVKDANGEVSAAWTAAPVAGRIIARIAPALGVKAKTFAAN